MAEFDQNVGYVHRELIEMFPYYQVVRDCQAGEMVIKWLGERYLPRASNSDRTASANDRYKTILAEAVYYNIVAAHTEYMTGQVFMRPPKVDLPGKLEGMRENVDGGGLSITQLCRLVVNTAILYSRYGLFVDYPNKKEATTEYELDAGLVAPSVNVYYPWQIANWRTVKRGGKRVLTLVVLHEIEDSSTDGFDHVESTNIRVLRLNNAGDYEVSIYKTPFLTELTRFDRQDYTLFDSKKSGSVDKSGFRSNMYYTEYLSSYPLNYLADFRAKEQYELLDRFVPKANGKPLKTIPFVFGGANFNTPEVERPVMFDIASASLGLYRDSALNQQMLRVHGSGTPWFAGLNRQWIRQVMGGKLALGSASAIKLPTGGTAGMLQGVANTAIREAMQDKWGYIAALGARILTGQQHEQKSATEFSLESSEFNSGLALIAGNAAQAITEALGYAGKFLGMLTKRPNVDLLQDYGLERLSPQQRHQLMVEVQGNLISWSEGRKKLDEAGITSLTDEEARKEIEEQGTPFNQKNKEMQRPFGNELGDESEDEFAKKEKKKELQAKADGGPKEGEKAGPQDAPTK